MLTNKYMNKTLATVLVSTILGGLFGSYITINYASSLPWANGQNVLLPNKILSQSDDSNSNKNTNTIAKSEEDTIVDVVDKASPSVVSISIEKDVSQNMQQVDPFFNGWPFFYGAPQQQEPQQTEPDWQTVGGGTGFIISSDGYILTNKHVVADSEARYKVTLNDGTEYNATLVGTDLFNDIGALKIDAKDLPTLELGDSDNLVIGQSVIAIGNALAQFSNTVTTGVVSGISRSIVASSGGSSEKLEDVIQTDAAINPGNSGGPLLNLDGQVIGINTAISNQGQLIGFAIPINSAKSIIKSVTESGEIVRPYLGVRYLMLNSDIAKANNLEINQGALIVRGNDQTQLAVAPGSPADKAGLLENDIILEVDGQQLTEDYPLAKAISQHSPGDQVKLKIWSKGQKKDITVNLDKYKQQ